MTTNRTIKELKHRNLPGYGFIIGATNRTIKELKLLST